KRPLSVRLFYPSNTLTLLRVASLPHQQICKFFTIFSTSLQYSLTFKSDPTFILYYKYNNKVILKEKKKVKWLAAKVAAQLKRTRNYHCQFSLHLLILSTLSSLTIHLALNK
ncbi:hypothetical protein ABN262_23465, partial [Citrobacter youngae]|uniref:hypothetical protein n=1 Tax=Citrobacter youngae TaxID=133448 RepID=UPI0032DAF0A5